MSVWVAAVCEQVFREDEKVVRAWHRTRTAVRALQRAKLRHRTPIRAEDVTSTAAAANAAGGLLMSPGRRRGWVEEEVDQSVEAELGGALEVKAEAETEVEAGGGGGGDTEGGGDRRQSGPGSASDSGDASASGSSANHESQGGCAWQPAPPLLPPDLRGGGIRRRSSQEFMRPDNNPHVPLPESLDSGVTEPSQSEPLQGPPLTPPPQKSVHVSFLGALTSPTATSPVEGGEMAGGVRTGSPVDMTSLPKLNEP